MTNKIIVIILLFVIPACGGDKVEYDLTCGHVDCKDADDVSVYNSGNDRAIDCTWHCASWNGSDDLYVNLTFWSWDGGCFGLEDTFVSGGICD